MNLKKLSIIVVAGAVMLTSAITLAVQLRPNVEIEIGAGQGEYRVNGNIKEFNVDADNLPYIDEATQQLMLPLRTVIAELKGSITWVEDEKAIELVYENKNIWMHMDSLKAAINGYPIVLKDAPVLSKGTIYVAADFFKTYFGTDVQWDGTKKQITLKSKRAFQPVVAVNQKKAVQQEGSYIIEIPVIAGLNDGSFEKSLNDLLSKQEIALADAFLTNAKIMFKEGDAPSQLTISCTIPYSRQEMISILLKGEIITPTGKKVVQRAINVDLQGQKLLSLNDLFRDENDVFKLANNLNVPPFLMQSHTMEQFYFNEKQQLVLFFEQESGFAEYVIDWDEIEGMIKPQYRFFTAANMKK